MYFLFQLVKEEMRREKQKNIFIGKQISVVVFIIRQKHLFQHYSTVGHCFLKLPEDMVDNNHLDLENINERQDEDDKLTQSTVKHPT
jgi:hypothetical protein